MLKAVIFDLDGLLVDSTPLHQETNRQFIESFGKIYFTPEGGREGMRIVEIIRDYKDIFELPGTVDELYRKRQDIYFAIARKRLTLFPDTMQIVGRVQARGLKIALATSGDRDYVRLVFAKFPKLGMYFEKAVTSEDVTRGKPYPDVYRKALDMLGVSSHEAVVIEDSFNGVAAAKAAGIGVIAVPNRHYPGADFSLADKVFADLGGVAKAIAL